VGTGGRAGPPLLTRLGHDHVLLTRDPGTYQTAGGDAPCCGTRTRSSSLGLPGEDPAVLRAATREGRIRGDRSTLGGLSAVTEGRRARP
jgi:hypothetical protein